MKIYIARHGQTDWNVEHKAQGRTDIPLNDTGKKQAEELRNNIKDIKFDAVYASPLKRAAETAQIATDGRNEIIYDDRLMERRFGELEGTVLAETWPRLRESVASKIDIDDAAIGELPSGIETIKSMLSRAGDFVVDLKRNHGSDSNILIVTHGALLKVLDWHLSQHEDGSAFIFEAVHLDNGEVKVYDF